MSSTTFIPWCSQPIFTFTRPSKNPPHGIPQGLTHLVVDCNIQLSHFDLHNLRPFYTPFIWSSKFFLNMKRSFQRKFLKPGSKYFVKVSSALLSTAEPSIMKTGMQSRLSCCFPCQAGLCNSIMAIAPYLQSYTQVICSAGIVLPAPFSSNPSSSAASSRSYTFPLVLEENGG